MKRYQGPLLFLVFWLGLLAVGNRFLRDPGQFWHTRVGEDILTGGFVRTDPYTFTFHGTTWTPYQWLGEVVMSVCYRVSGFDTQLVLATALVAGLYAWLATQLLRTGLHPIFAVGATFFTLFAASTHFHVRPHLFTMIGMVITFWMLAEYEANRIKLRQLLWLVPLYWVWTNIHGGMMGGLATLAMAGAGWILMKLLKRPNAKPWKDLLGFTGIAIVCGAMAFCSPYGIEMVRTWLYINNGMTKLPQLIVEHSPLDFKNPFAWPTVILALAYVKVLLLTFPRRPQVVWLIPLFWMVQSFFRVRHGAIFAPIALLMMAEIWPHTILAKWLALKRPDVYVPQFSRPHEAWKILLTAAVALAIAVGFQSAKVNAPLVGHGWAKLDPRHWPTDSDEVLKKYEPVEGQNRRIFCEYHYGGYLIHRFPGYRVFVDDRCEVFGDDWLEAYVKADEANTAEYLERMQNQYGDFAFAITTTTDRDNGYDAYFRNRPEVWERFKTTTANFYRRK
jgi:hypothetical protein